ncbi:hypothetical protein SUDANB15_05235 [Streptomyces sp. enrichment culture]|uniref:hypothetical protein n=1 Tax=Streptomyces sp. enrichment culture TaxID=1795815 RepID=UPI003F571983
MADGTIPAGSRTPDSAGAEGLGVTEVIVTGCATGVRAGTAARRAPGRGYDLVAVADGHAPSERSGADSAGSIGRPGRRVRGRAVAEADSGAPEGAAELTPA